MKSKIALIDLRSEVPKQCNMGYKVTLLTFKVDLLNINKHKEEDTPQFTRKRLISF